MIPENIVFDNSSVHLNNDILDILLTGAKITGAETVDYPETDGYTLYLEYPDGRKAVLCFDVDPFTEKDEKKDPLQMSFCFIQESAETIRETDISRTVGVKKCPKCHKNT